MPSTTAPRGGAILEDLQAKLKESASFLIGNSSFRRYLKLGQKSEIDWEKVKEEERYGGKWVLLTNTDLSHGGGCP